MKATGRPLMEIAAPSGCDTFAAYPDKREALIEGLNQDLSAKYRAVLMYIHFAAKLTGPNRGALRALFQAEAADEQIYAQFYFQRINAMSGKPTAKSRPVPYFTEPREMIEWTMKSKRHAIAYGAARIDQAKECGEISLLTELEEQLADKIRHMQAFKLLIDAWSSADLERAQNDELWQDIGGQG